MWDGLCRERAAERTRLRECRSPAFAVVPALAQPKLQAVHGVVAVPVWLAVSPPWRQSWGLIGVRLPRQAMYGSQLAI